MKYLILIVLFSLFLSLHGFEKKQNEVKSKLKSILGSQGKSRQHQKITDHSQKHSVSSKTMTKTDPIYVLDPNTLDSATAAKIFSWFFPGMGFETATYAPTCIDMAFCMVNNAQWGSNLENMVPRNPYPLEFSDIKEDLEDILKRVFIDGEGGKIFDNLRVTLANNFRTPAELCKSGTPADKGTCKLKECTKLFGYPAVLAPIGDATDSGILSHCSTNSDCKPDTWCAASGGTPICESKTFFNKCHCFWILAPSYADSTDSMCGTTIDSIDTFKCNEDCGPNVQVEIKNGEDPPAPAVADPSR